MNKSNKNLRFETKYKCKSVNLSNLINSCRERDIILKDIYKGQKYTTFYLSEKDCKKIKQLDLSKFELVVEKQGGIEYIKKSLINHIGLIIGIVVCILTFFCVQDRILQFHIMGNTSINSKDIEQEIKEYGINYFSSAKFDKAALEKHLSDKFDFSLVSVISKGNSLIVNVKESIKNIKDNYAPITADCNMIIKSIEVYAGTQVVNPGDIVFKGSVLVEPYYQDGSDIVYIEPRAKIVAEVFWSEAYTFLEKEKEQVRSGKKTIINKTISLSRGINFVKINKANPYTNFEIIEKNRNMVNYYIPINECLLISYELIEVEKLRDFELEKDRIIEDLKNKVYGNVFDDVENLQEDISITEISGGKIVNFSVNGVYTFRYVLDNL